MRQEFRRGDKIRANLVVSPARPAAKHALGKFLRLDALFQRVVKPLLAAIEHSDARQEFVPSFGKAGRRIGRNGCRAAQHERDTGPNG